LNKNATPIWYQNRQRNGQHWTPGVGDFNGDGSLEFLTTERYGRVIRALDAKSGQARWTLTLPDTPDPMVTADIDGDGRDEAVFAIWNQLFAVGSNSAGTAGQVEWSMNFASNLGMPIIADATGSGSAQILVVSDDGRLLGIG
jgi:hypothetical protein